MHHLIITLKTELNVKRYLQNQTLHMDFSYYIYQTSAFILIERERERQELLLTHAIK